MLSVLTSTYASSLLDVGVKVHRKWPHILGDDLEMAHNICAHPIRAKLRHKAPATARQTEIEGLAGLPHMHQVKA